METEFLLEQYRTLRGEIKAIKSRLFTVVVLGSVAVPALTFLAETTDARFVGPIVPFVVLVLTVVFVAEEQALMRCGRFIRQRVEPNFPTTEGWESWLETQPGIRVVDKCLFGCFLITFFVFYFVSSGMAIEALWTSGDAGMPADYKALAGGVVYGIAAMWMVFTVMHHWKSATSTSG